MTYRIVSAFWRDHKLLAFAISSFWVGLAGALTAHYRSIVTWEQAFQNVLRFHYLAFPAMSRYIQLNQPDAVMGYKQAILARISPEYQNTTLYMSVVRSMSPSQRSLLTAYLNGTPWQP